MKPPVPQRSNPAIPQSKISIFIVQGQSEPSDNMLTLLENTGYQISGQANSGEEALSRLSELIDEDHQPDIALVDSALPGNRSGSETAEAINDIHNMAVILLVNVDEKMESQHFAAVGPYLLTSKPINLPNIKLVIQTALQQRNLKQQALSQQQQLDKLYKDLSDTNKLLEQETLIRQRAEETLSKTRGELDILVQKQTAELLISNKLLKRKISDGKRTEKALKMSETRYLSMIENQNELIVQSTPEGSITFINQACAKFLEKGRDELVGQNRISFVFDEDQHIIKQNTDQLSKGNDVVTYECRVNKSNEEPHWIRWTDQAIFNDQGKLAEVQSQGYDITEQKLAEEKLIRQAMYDPLTKLPNRYLLEDRLNEAIFQSRRSNTLVSLALLDIDAFKDINDALGHNIGDELLVAFARRLETNIRESDTLARMSADDFVIILTNLHELSDIDVVINKLLDTLKEPFVLSDNELFITASIGYAVFPEDGKDNTSLLKNADSALAHSKSSVQANITRFEPIMHTLAHERLQLTNRLRRAIESEELTLYYQPQINLKNHQVIGIEALVRWDHPETGLIPPNNFIPLAEESGLIHPIGDWVLKEACRHYTLWQEAGHPSLHIGVNFSAVQFMQTNFVEWYSTTLQSYNIDPSIIAVEITESLFMNDLDMVIHHLEQARSLGSHIEIDDFGTVYSSLAYLRDLPIDVLKIDKTFIWDLTKPSSEKSDPRAMVQAIITLGHSLKLQVLAEGVETQEQLNILNSLDCDLAQGFLFARPMPADKLWETIYRINEGK
jgi:diguanylate cyclase (GGDEF)-like protein/PAS domain S-box-containing protein